MATNFEVEDWLVDLTQQWWSGLSNGFKGKWQKVTPPYLEVTRKQGKPCSQWNARMFESYMSDVKRVAKEADWKFLRAAVQEDKARQEQRRAFEAEQKARERAFKAEEEARQRALETSFAGYPQFQAQIAPGYGQTAFGGNNGFPPEMLPAFTPAPMQAVGQAVGGFDMPPNDAQMFAPYQAQEQSMGGLNMPPNNPPFVGAHSVAAMQDLINFDDVDGVNMTFEAPSFDDPPFDNLMMLGSFLVDQPEMNDVEAQYAAPMQDPVAVPADMGQEVQYDLDMSFDDLSGMLEPVQAYVADPVAQNTVEGSVPSLASEQSPERSLDSLALSTTPPTEEVENTATFQEWGDPSELAAILAFERSFLGMHS